MSTISIIFFPSQVKIVTSRGKKNRAFQFLSFKLAACQELRSQLVVTGTPGHGAGTVTADGTPGHGAGTVTAGGTPGHGAGTVTADGTPGYGTGTVTAGGTPGHGAGTVTADGTPGHGDRPAGAVTGDCMSQCSGWAILTVSEWAIY